jgi:hypothetical protein
MTHNASMTLHPCAPVVAFLAALLLGGCVSPPPRAAASPSPTACTAAAATTVPDARLQRAVAEARKQHRLFGSQTVERNGGMFDVGAHEGMFTHAQRVAVFWEAVAEGAPETLVTSAGRIGRAEVAPATAGGDPRADAAVRESLLRAAVIDTPWSAAFISHLVKTAGFSATEFVFSDRHADYVQAAYEATAAEAEGRAAPHAWRACDVATTPPRVGDLLCATRAGTAHIDRFDALRGAMAARQHRAAFPMHCDLVVRADAAPGGGLDVIGGNVLHSVTMVRMTLDANRRLDARYIGRGTPAQPCTAQDEDACRPHLGRRPWVVLLQFRG